MHAQHRKAASANRATDRYSLESTLPETVAEEGANVPCGHLRIGKLRASVASIPPPTAANGSRQPYSWIRNVPANGNNPCPSAPPAVTTPVTSPRCCGNHSPLVETRGA